MGTAWVAYVVVGLAVSMLVGTGATLVALARKYSKLQK